MSDISNLICAFHNKSNLFITIKSRQKLSKKQNTPTLTSMKLKEKILSCIQQTRAPHVVPTLVCHFFVVKKGAQLQNYSFKSYAPCLPTASHLVFQVWCLYL